MATLKDVSEAAGVSMQAVSLVLNGKAEGQISKKNCEKILAAAEELDFRLNHNARRMRNKCTENLSVLIDDIGQPYGDYPDFRSDVNMESLYGILDCAAQYGYDIKLLPMNTRNLEDLSLLDKRIGPPYSDGVIFHGLYYRKNVFELIRNRKMPYVLLSTLDERQPSPKTEVDPVPAMRAAVARLIEQGHRKIAWCSHRDPRTSFLPLRFRGYEEEMKAAGLYDEELIMIAEDELAVRRVAADRVMRDRFTAVVCMNDEMAYRWILECRYNGVRVPEDIAVIGFDGSYKYNFISTIDLCFYDCGYRAAEELIKSIQSGRTPRNITIKSKFLERKTN